VIGQRFFEPILCRVAERDGTLPAALHALTNAELLNKEALYPEAEYAFKHPLTREGSSYVVQHREGARGSDPHGRRRVAAAMGAGVTGDGIAETFNGGSVGSSDSSSTLRKAS
jgi:hypothetical protein